MRWWWGLLLTSGCFTKPSAPMQADDARTDGVISDGAEPQDGGRADAVVCMPWSVATALGSVNTSSNEDGPALRPTGDWLAFVSLRAGGTSDLYISARMSGGFSTAVLAIGQTTTTEYSATWSNLGNVLYFTQDGAWKKSSFNGGTVGTPFAAVDLAATSAQKPTFFDQDRGIVFTNGADLYVAVRPDATTVFGSKTLLSVSDSVANDSDPTVTPDGLVLYFTSDRTGSKKVYRTTRPDLTSDFDPPQLVPEFGDVADLEVNATDTEMFFTIGATTDIYMSTRTCP
jgi:hypothetical protein